MKSLSIVIPAYNESSRIGSSLESVLAYIKGGVHRTEVIVIDDGSTDGTPGFVEGFCSRFIDAGATLRVLRNPGNHGKGYSVRHGMLGATGEIVLFTDADLSTPISEAEKLITPIVSGDYDVAFGSRALAYEKIRVHQSRFRELVGRSFNFLMRFITKLPFKDTQCGFKAFRRGAVRPIFTRQLIDGFGFDVEVLYIARKLGFRMTEVPVEWSNVEGSKVGLLSGGRSYFDLVSVRKNDIVGRYNHRSVAIIGEKAATDLER